MAGLISLFHADESTLFREVRDGVLRLYAPRGPNSALRLARNLAWLSLATMLPCLLAFLLRRPTALQSGMWLQVGLHGLPIVLLVNLVAARFYGAYLPRLLSGNPAANLAIIFGDATARMALTIALTAVSFVVWAAIKGSFAGSTVSALGAVPSSFRFGIRFESLTGVYLYAVGLGAMPVFALAFLPLLASQRWCRVPLSALAAVVPPLRHPALATALAFCLFSVPVLGLTYLLLGRVPA